jgi:hypothetical protein
MSDSTSVAKTDSAELGLPKADLDALRAQQDAEFDDSLLTAPILKIAQALTREVQEGEAEAGEFINSVTGDSLGDKVEFIAAYYQKGRFAADRQSGRAFVAFGSTIPEAWEPLVGAQYVGTPFVEHPDAEETYKERVNRKEIEWGKGPMISTTHNFTGLAIVEDIDGEEEVQPVRLSLKRTDVPVVKKWQTLIKSKRNAAIWDYVYELGTQRKAWTQGSSYLLTVSRGRVSTSDERMQAVELAQAVAAGRVNDNSAGDVEKQDAPAANGGLDV